MENIEVELRKLQDQYASLLQRMENNERENNARFATKAYVQTYIDHLIGDIIPTDDPFTENSPIAGYVPLDIERVHKHFQREQQYYTSADWLYILNAYDNAAQQGNINPYIAIAQMAKETDWGRSFWSRRPQRNPAGLGVTGQFSIDDPRTPDNKHLWAFNVDRNRWEYGYSFPDWKISAQAHIGHLLAYMYIQEALVSDQLSLVAVDPRANAIPKNIRGTVKILKDLDGKWNAPNSVGYGKSIATLANALKQ